MVRRRVRFRLGGRGKGRGVAQSVATALLVVITVILVIMIYMIKFPVTPAPPLVSYQAVTGATRPVWGDPTDCYPDTLPNPPSYYLGTGKSATLYNTYMDAWDADCQTGDSGTYNNMNVTAIEIEDVSAPIPLSEVLFQFVCTNQTPKYVQTTLVSGPLGYMEWVPGSSQALNSSTAPLLGKCATYDASGKGANSVYYNRLGYFDPVDYKNHDLGPDQTLYIYVHTPDSVLEAPNPLFPASTWNISDGDDYHGAPPWCFTVPGACQINLYDEQWKPAVLLTSIPLYIL